MSTPNLVSTPIADRLASLFGKREVPDPPASDPAREGDPTPPGKGDPRRWTDFDRDEADADRMFWPGPEPRRVVIDVSRPLSEQVSRTLLELNRRGILHSVDHKLVAASTDGSRIVQLSRPVTKAVVEDAIVCVAFVEKKTKRDGTVVPEGVSIVPTPSSSAETTRNFGRSWGFVATLS